MILRLARRISKGRENGSSLPTPLSGQKLGKEVVHTGSPLYKSLSVQTQIASHQGTRKLRDVQKIMEAADCGQGSEYGPSWWHRVLLSTKLPFPHLKEGVAV